MTFQELKNHLETKVWNSNFQNIHTKGALKAYLQERCEFGLNKGFETQEELEALIDSVKQAPVKFMIPRDRNQGGSWRNLTPKQRKFYDFAKTAAIEGAVRLEKVVDACTTTLRDTGIGEYELKCFITADPERNPVTIRTDSLEQMVGYFLADEYNGDLEGWEPIRRY